MKLMIFVLGFIIWVISVYGMLVIDANDIKVLQDRVKTLELKK